jgi:hypothetical protein
MTSTPGEPQPVTSPDPNASLVAQWAACGIAVGAARFIPIPLLDDSVRLRATQVAVVRTLRANGRTYPSDRVEALYAGADAGAAGRFRELTRYLRSIPRRVLLFPARKYVAVFGAVRGVPTDVMKVLLLARVVQHCLVKGRLATPDGSEPGRSLPKAQAKELAAEAVRIRVAYEEALHGMDLRLLTAALADGLSGGKGLTRAAVGYARNTFGHPDQEAESGVETAELNPGGEVGAGAERVEEVLRRPEIALLLEEFDAAFEEALTAAR